MCFLGQHKPRLEGCLFLEQSLSDFDLEFLDLYLQDSGDAIQLFEYIDWDNVEDTLDEVEQLRAVVLRNRELVVGTNLNNAFKRTLHDSSELQEDSFEEQDRFRSP